MITVILPADDARILAALLGDLVPAAADGLVRQVLVLDDGVDETVRAVCDDAGADLVGASLADAIARARADWLLLLPADLRLRRGWEDGVAVHLQVRPGPARLTDARAPAGGLKRLFNPPAVGVLASRAAVAALAAVTLDQARARLGRRAVRLG